MALRELEPIGQVLVSPICKYDIDEEQNEPFEFSEEMINDMEADVCAIRWKESMAQSSAVCVRNPTPIDG